MQISFFGSIVLVAVVGVSLALAGCTPARIESRVTELETQISTLTTALLINQFFDAPELWELVWGDAGVCQNECRDVLDAALLDCGEDPDCITTALDDAKTCLVRCAQFRRKSH